LLAANPGGCRKFVNMSFLILFFMIGLAFCLVFFLLLPVDIRVHSLKGIYEIRYAKIFSLAFCFRPELYGFDLLISPGFSSFRFPVRPNKEIRHFTRKSKSTPLRKWHIRPNLPYLFKQVEIKEFEIDVDASLPWLSVWMSYLSDSLARLFQLKLNLNQEGIYNLRFQARFIPIKLIMAFILTSRRVRF